MAQDLEVRFTDKEYATKSYVKEVLKISSIDLLWERIKEYRRRHQLELSLRNIERLPFSVSTVQSISSKIVSLEKKLNKILIAYSRLENLREIHQNFRKDRLKDCLIDFVKYYGLHVNDDTLLKIIDGEINSLPNEYLVITHYSDTLKRMENRFSSPFNLSVLVNIYSSLCGIEHNVEKKEDYLRTTDLNERLDHVLVKRHYEGAPLDRIEPMLNEMFNFANDESVFSLIRASAVFYYIMYIKPFEYFNEFVALLSFKYILAHSDLDQIAVLLDVESLIGVMNDEHGKHMVDETEKGLDLTYILLYSLDEVEAGIAKFNDAFVNADREQVQEENFRFETPHYHEETKNIESDEIEKAEKAERPEDDEFKDMFERQVAIPKLRTGLDEKDAVILAEHLIESYPSLKRGQAFFYARHCTVGNYYTIGQYKQETKVAYETARTSMDNLATLGFYKKEKVRNKFVYTPVVQR